MGDRYFYYTVFRHDIINVVPHLWYFPFCEVITTSCRTVISLFMCLDLASVISHSIFSSAALFQMLIVPDVDKEDKGGCCYRN